MGNKPLFELGITTSSQRDTDVELNVSVGDKAFRIDLFTANFESNPELLEKYLRHVERSDPMYIPPEDDEDEFFDDPLEEFYDWAMEPFIPLFRRIPPLASDRVYTLQDCLFPKPLVYTLKVNGDKMVPVRCDIGLNTRLVGVLLPYKSKMLDNFPLPIYRPKDIHVPLNEDAVALSPCPRHVYIKGKEAYFFKQILAGDVGMTVTELATYRKIHVAEFGEDVRISRLRGIVQDEDTSRIVGLLFSYIDCRNKTLYCAAKPGRQTLHEKWLKQITYSLKQLHAGQIVWGDAKPANVLIDVNDDAYLIDFGGGYTNGWVDKELMNTQEGDLQGLKRISEYLARNSS